MHWTFELDEQDGETTVSVCGESLAGERLDAWNTLADTVLGGLEHSGAAYVEAMERVARGEPVGVS
jgi:hypothetical protein